MRTRFTSVRRAVVVWAAIAMIGVASGGADPPIPANLQAAIIMRMLGYDRALKGRAGKELVVGIVAKTSDRVSIEAQVEMQKAFDALPAQDVRGLPLRALSLNFKGPAEVGTWIAHEGIGVLYVPPGLDKELAAIRAICTERHTVAVTPVRLFVDQGLPLGIVLKEGRPSIVVNLPAAEAVGMDLDPKLLALSQVIR